MAIPERSLNDLVSEFKDTGSSVAFGALLKEVSKVISFKVNAAISSLPYRSDMREELTSAAFECLLSTIRTFDPEKATFKTYLGSALDKHLVKAGSASMNTIRVSSTWVTQYRAASQIRSEEPGLSVAQIKERLRENALDKALVRCEGNLTEAEDSLVSNGILVAIENIEQTERLLNVYDLDGEAQIMAVSEDMPADDNTLSPGECRKILNNPVRHPGFSAILVEEVAVKPLRKQDLQDLVQSSILGENHGLQSYAPL